MSVVDKSSAYPDTVQPGLPRLGKTPPGWRRSRMSELLYEERRPVELLANATYDLVTVKRARGGVVKRETKRGADISVKTQFRVNDGDFLISKRQIVHGACGIVPPELDGATVSNEYSVLRSKGGIDLDYLKYLSHSVYFQQTCFHSSIGVHIEKMIFKLEKWLDWEFDLPPLDEQQRIARILSTWDSAIALTGRLAAIDKKQHDALVHRLVHGLRRLPGFQDTWKAQRLKDAAEVIVSNVDKKTSDDEQAVRLCNYTDVYARDVIAADQHFMRATASIAQIERFRLQLGDVVITKDSETPEDIAVPSVVISTAPDLICGYHLAILRPKPGNSGPFLKFLLQGNRVRSYFRTRANGATRFGLPFAAIEEAPLVLPSAEEQHAIALVLSVSEALVSRALLAKERLSRERAGAMQQLLTGKRRVSTKKEAA